MTIDGQDPAARRPTTSAPKHELLAALLDGQRLGEVVPVTLDVVEHDPHATGGCFPGDLLRGLMELPAGIWARHPRLYDRYRRVLRASATERRHMTFDVRMAFWTPLEEIARDRASWSVPPDHAREARR